MTLVLYGHPFSSYSQKALIALYENATPFEFKVLGPSTPENFEALKALADAPSLFYADWAHPISDEFSELRAYRNRLLARPSFARAVGEARPYRQYFPLGAPDRD